MYITHSLQSMSKLKNSIEFLLKRLQTDRMYSHILNEILLNLYRRVRKRKMVVITLIQVTLLGLLAICIAIPIIITRAKSSTPINRK